jgi:hypothetical protein
MTEEEYKQAEVTYKLEKYKQVEVTYKFFLPDNEEDLKDFRNGRDYAILLWDIQQKCRHVWKYEEDPSEDRVALAEEIGDMIGERELIE